MGIIRISTGWSDDFKLRCFYGKINLAPWVTSFNLRVAERDQSESRIKKSESHKIMIEIASFSIASTEAIKTSYSSQSTSLAPEKISKTKNSDSLLLQQAKCVIKINKSISQSFNLQSPPLISQPPREGLSKKKAINVVTFYWLTSLSLFFSAKVDEREKQKAKTCIENS